MVDLGFWVPCSVLRAFHSFGLIFQMVLMSSFRGCMYLNFTDSRCLLEAEMGIKLGMVASLQDAPGELRLLVFTPVWCLPCWTSLCDNGIW